MTRKPKPATSPVDKPPVRDLTQGQRVYETRRAAEAGLTLDAWLDRKARAAKAVSAAAAKASSKEPAKKSLLGRLLDRAHKPLKPKNG